jgi:hypothetical protein
MRRDSEQTAAHTRGQAVNPVKKGYVTESFTLVTAPAFPALNAECSSPQSALDGAHQLPADATCASTGMDFAK